MNTQVVVKTRKKISPLGLARAAWLVLAALILIALVQAAPVYLAQQTRICTADSSQCAQAGLMTVENLRQIEAVGITLPVWGAYTLISRLILNTLFFLTALIIFLRKPGDWMPLFVAFFLLTFSANNGIINALGLVSAPWAILARGLTAAAWVSFLLFFTLFPSGHFAPPWMGWVVLAYSLVLLSSLVFSGTSLDIGTLLPWFGTIYFPTLFAFMLGAQVYRYRRISTANQRRQTKWVVYGISMMLVLAIAFSLPMIFSPAYTQSTFIFILSGGLANYILLLLPLSIGAAMIRSRLWEIDILINRTLVYGMLTLVFGASYMLIVGGITSVYKIQDDLWVSLLVAALVAVLFQPLREQLQRGVNRLMYGQRDEPYTVLSRLSARLETSLAPDAVLPAIVETTAQALKLPYAAILLGSGESQALGAEYPDHSERWKQAVDLIHFPILYQGEVLGELVVAPRAPGELFTEPDERLLADLVRQAGTAIHAVRLTIDLQHAREQLVLALEEERRRLRRDLHDGLGPSLANVAMLTETARDLYKQDPNQAENILNKAVRQTQEAIEDIRRLVYNLRPPALDELGLIAALREQIGEYEHTGIEFQFTAPVFLPQLPAAIEVAVYRITLEAVNNVVQHAKAKQCFISLALAETLDLSIWDDGSGVPVRHRAGVGLQSMRERAAELGGICMIESGERGTTIQVKLPFLKVG
jgi:signal transduction histidine kinase